jgi:hypothetical protein
MNNDLFPSGPWIGFYTYSGSPRRHRMDLALEFGKGRITGEGHDDIGAFIISGRFDSATGECRWTKTYVAAHDVFYQGARAVKGIGGSWEIGATDRGGFRIWPLMSGEGEVDSDTGEEEQTADAVGPAVAGLPVPIG